MKFIELFAGIGGFRYGLEKAGNFKCVWANEWEKYVCQIYRKNFGDKELAKRDIRRIPTESIPDFGLLTAGFPCQSFSIAGKRKGFGDTRGTLFFEICRIVEAKRPNLLLLENVKGLLNHDGGNTFRIILNSLSELGYDCEWEVLNSKNFGVPQNRERVFIIGHLRGKGGQKVFPIREANQTYNNDKQVYSSTLFRDYGEQRGGTYIRTKSTRIRRLTPIECERLQGFPDNWTEGPSAEIWWLDRITDKQRYECLGNAVTTNVVTEIGRKILKVNI